jgi:hypothetical protein
MRPPKRLEAPACRTGSSALNDLLDPRLAKALQRPLEGTGFAAKI